MNVLFYMGVGFSLLLVKTTLLMPWPPVARMFDPFLVITVYLGLFRPGITYAAVAIFLGYLADIFSGSRFGFHVIIASSIYYLTSLLRARFFLDSRFFQGVYLAAMVLVHAIVGSLVFSLMGAEAPTSYLFDEIIGRMALNAGTGLLLFAWMRKTEERWAPLSARRPSGIHLD